MRRGVAPANIGFGAS